MIHVIICMPMYKTLQEPSTHARSMHVDSRDVGTNASLYIYLGCLLVHFVCVRTCIHYLWINSCPQVSMSTRKKAYIFTIIYSHTPHTSTGWWLPEKRVSFSLKNMLVSFHHPIRLENRKIDQNPWKHSTFIQSAIIKIQDASRHIKPLYHPSLSTGWRPRCSCSAKKCLAPSIASMCTPCAASTSTTRSKREVMLLVSTWRQKGMKNLRIHGCGASPRKMVS